MNQAALDIAGEIRRRRGSMTGGDGRSASRPGDSQQPPRAQRGEELTLINGLLIALTLTIGKPYDMQAAEDLISQPANIARRPGEADELIAWAESLGLDAEDLDDLVHDLVSQQASSINNGGLDSQIEFLVEACGPQQARSVIWECRADPLEAIADLRGSMADGYTDDDVNRILGRISDASGLQLVCVWDRYDDCGVGGNSQFYVLDGEVLREVAGDLWRWLNGDPEDPDTPVSPGAPSSWAGELADFTTAGLPYDDGFRNYAMRDTGP